MQGLRARIRNGVLTEGKERMNENWEMERGKYYPMFGCFKN
jgi:hypothetical protein